MTKEEASPSPVSWRSWPSRVSSTGALCRTAARAGRRERPVPWPSVTSWSSPGRACPGTGHWAQLWAAFQSSIPRGFLLPSRSWANQVRYKHWQNDPEKPQTLVCTGTMTSGRSQSEPEWWSFIHSLWPFNPKCCIPVDFAVLIFLNNRAQIAMFCYSFALGCGKWNWAVELLLVFVMSW